MVRSNQIIVALTPSAIFVSSFISYNRILDKKDGLYHKKFGSLFLEFKNQKGFLSTQYYCLFFIRRLAYLISQVYLNSYPYIQAGVNIGFSALNGAYLLYYAPFKERSVLISCLTGDLCVLIVFCLTPFYLGDITSELSYIFETICIYSVIGCMGMQLIISVYSLITSFKKIFRKIMKYRASAFVKNYDLNATNTHIKNYDLNATNTQTKNYDLNVVNVDPESTENTNVSDFKVESPNTLKF